MSIPRLLAERADAAPEAVALLEPARSITYEGLHRLSNRFARLFADHGVGRGDRVVIALENSIESVAAYFGAMKAGGAAVPLPSGPRSDRLGAAIADCSPRIGVIDAATAGRLDAASPIMKVPTIFVAQGAAPSHVPRALDPLDRALDGVPDDWSGTSTLDSDLAAVIYTSGSTGEPRGVMLTHRNFVSNAQAIVSYLELTAGDRVMCILPFYYVYGLSLLHTHVMVGGSVVIDNRFTFPNVVLDAMQRFAITGFAGVPSTFGILLRRSKLADLDVPSLRYVTQAGGAMPIPWILEWLDRGPRVPFFVMYGATEAAARLSYLPPARLREKLGSIGQPVPGVDIVVRRDDGARAEVGEVGELVASGSSIACGYWNSPKDTERAFTAGGYRTGDLGYRDEEGFLYLVGRRHDMIKVGAHRVGAKEIEDVLHAHPSVLEAAVVPAPHDLLGEVPVACVVLKRASEDTATVLQAFCATRLAPHKVPARVIVCVELPKSEAGKIDKKPLVELARSVAVRPVG
jgi:long-chain acyl-CoA synthetase